METYKVIAAIFIGALGVLIISARQNGYLDIEPWIAKNRKQIAFYLWLAIYPLVPVVGVFLLYLVDSL